MSSEALAWAFKQDVKPSAVKFTLIALCECANYKTGHIFPSIKHLAEITGQNRKTIITNIQKLEQAGLLIDTGERVGTTKQIKVYRATTETVPNTEQSQIRNSSVSDVKQSQKRDTEPSREPSKKRVTNVTPKVSLKPDGLPEQIWKDWRSVRKRPVTETVLARIQAEADKLGWTLVQAITEAAGNGWQGFNANWVKENGGNNGSGKKSGSGDGLFDAAAKQLAAASAGRDGMGSLPDYSGT